MVDRNNLVSGRHDCNTRLAIDLRLDHANRCGNRDYSLIENGARTGKQMWLYDPKVAGAWNINICCGVDNRGAAAWNGKIIYGTLDGRLIALDAKTGKPVWTVKSTPDERRYSITGAPRIANGKIFVANRNQLYALKESGATPGSAE